MASLDGAKFLYLYRWSRENIHKLHEDQGCISGLTMFLDGTTHPADVVLLTLKTLHLLAEHKPNRQILYKSLGMMQSIRKLMDDDCDKYKDNAELKKLASSLYNKLQPPIKNISSGTSSNRSRIHTVAPTQQKFFVGATNKKAKLITLQVKGLYDDETRKVCEENLLAIKGVVSFTFNMAKQRCMVRVTPMVSPEALCSAINQVKSLSAEQVVRNKSGEEVTISFGAHPEIPQEEKGSSTLTEDDYPDYLPEEDPVETGHAAIAKTGKDDGSGGWFSGISSYINNTLYW